jgi:hypothetical protein
LEQGDAVDQLGIEEAVLELTEGFWIERVVPVGFPGGADGDAGCVVSGRDSLFAFGCIAGGPDRRGMSAGPVDRLRCEDAEGAG